MGAVETKKAAIIAARGIAAPIGREFADNRTAILALSVVAFPVVLRIRARRPGALHGSDDQPASGAGCGSAADSTRNETPARTSHVHTRGGGMGCNSAPHPHHARMPFSKAGPAPPSIPRGRRGCRDSRYRWTGRNTRCRHWAAALRRLARRNRPGTPVQRSSAE